MKRKIFLRTLTILLALCLMAAFSMTVLAVDERWESTTSRDEDGNICIDFAEVQVVLPSSWGGKVQMNISTDYVSFYHIGSRDAWTESLGYANGGHLFTIAYTEDDDYLDNPSYMVIGYTTEGTYYAWFPTDYQAWTGDADIQSEYNALMDDMDWVKANLTLTIETIIEIDSEYIFPESSTTYLTEDDLAGLTADEVQMAINEIYARHHRKFVIEEIQEYFDSKTWYSGLIEADDFDVSVMNIYEGSNINLMVEYLATHDFSADEDNSEYILPESATSYLDENDLVGLTADELQMAINEIYARHGRRFNTASIQEYFDSLSWYSGTIAASDFDVSVLNDYENTNIALLQKRIAALS